MIKTSALLVVLAIGLLVAGVLASSLPMVYVSIGVCAIAALLLAAGVLSHWSEIFGRREPRPSRMQPSWSEPQMQVSAPVLAGAQAAGAQVTGAQVTGAQTVAAKTAGAQTAGAQTGTQSRGTAAPEERRSRRGAAAGRSPVPPAEVVTPQAESAIPGRGDDLWERVEEELGTAGKRDTGALSWPATEIPVLREPAGPPEEAAPPGGPPAGSSAWIWGRGAGWQPPETPDEAWPPPAAAFAGSPARPERATTDADGSDGVGQDVDGPDQETGQPESAAPAGPARAADEAAPESVDEVAEQAPKTAPAKPDTWDERPRWIISVGDAAPARPVPGSAVSAPPASERTTGAAAGQPAAGKPAAGKPAAGKPEAAEPKPAETKAAETKGSKPGAAEPEPTTAAVAASAGQDAPAKAPAGPEAASREPALDVPQAEEPTAEESSSAEESAAEDSAAEESAAEDSSAEESAAEESAAEDSAGQGSAAGEPAADSPAEKPAPERIEVTVVPGVARYHRSECILIRFLGAGDLDIMTRQEAEEAKFAACRACQPDQIEA